jgi:hypothetical protein
LKVQHERSETKVGKKVFRRDSDEIFQIHEYILGEHGIYEQKKEMAERNRNKQSDAVNLTRERPRVENKQAARETNGNKNARVNRKPGVLFVCDPAPKPENSQARRVQIFDKEREKRRNKQAQKSSRR